VSDLLCQANALRIPLADRSVQVCITSPPYWGLRDYGVAGQLGLEPTPSEFVANMVRVFREVKRVLRDDGTLWMNMGDSYSGGKQGRSDEQDGGGLYNGEQRKALGVAPKQNAVPLGFKPKDLVGIPWLLAKALQAPYYTGEIKDERDRIWLAAMLDAEGCMFIHKRKEGQHNGQGYHRKNDSYGPGIEISNTYESVVNRIMAIVGKGSICSQGPEENNRRKQRIYRWNLRTTESRDLATELYPYLVAKQHQARLLIGCPPSGPQAEAAHLGLIGLHNGSTVDVDFPAPKSLFEPGWYLRSDIIWSKANPMPESVTDRPTKSHEYLFLLSKSERYFFDADAVREGAISGNDLGLLRGRSFVDGERVAWHAPSIQKRQNAGVDSRTANESGCRNIRTVWNIPTESYPGSHFATFPRKLVEPCVKAGSKPGDVVLDCFCGSGTTGVVALALGRRFVGLELNAEYIGQAVRRISRPHAAVVRPGKPEHHPLFEGVE
jgi:DNA modification methylase